MTLATVQNATGLVQFVPAMDEHVAAASSPEQVKDALDDVDQFEVFAKRFGVDNLGTRISIWRIDLRRKRAVEPETGGRGNKLSHDRMVSPQEESRDRQLATMPEQEWQELRAESIATDTPLSVSSVINRARHLEQGTGNNERYTPDYILEAVRGVTGGIIDLDPASSAEANETVQANRFFTLEDDGLAQDWQADSLWFNPPYARGDIEAFVGKLVAELDNIGLALGITHNATETIWCQTLLAQSAAICLLNSRVHFPTPGEGGNSGGLRGQVVFLLGKQGTSAIESFSEAFNSLGVVYVPYGRA